ncbi:hypothetical protein BGZ46_001373 [Entomortierella lignicola]|nr:hypothetical protein BGZ46_001373 [Entomortierella lignicola]
MTLGSTPLTFSYLETPKSFQAQSTLIQSNAAKFAISAISIHDTIASPVLALIVDRASSEVSVKSSFHDSMEYIQDPENALLRRNNPLSFNPTSSTSKELPPLLLKIQAREGLRLLFELTGDLLDSVQPSPEAQTGADEPNSDLNKQNDHDLHQAIEKEEQITRAEDEDINKAEAWSITASSQYQRNVLDPSSPLPVLSQNEVTGVSTSTSASTPDKTSTGSYTPTIYFAETQTEQSMHDLCSEDAFQQQLHDNPESISTVRASLSSELDPHSQVYAWEWSYQSEDRPERRSQSHKAVFGFMTRSHLTGALEVLAMFSLWIHHDPELTINNGVRFSSPQQQSTSAWNARHWRRTSTPEKNSNISRLPSFWSKLPVFPPNHGSLPVPQQETLLRVEGEKTTNDSFVPIRISPPIPLANGSEDGPLFRATVVECEHHIRNMKSASKRIIKAAQNVLETRRAWVAAEEAFAKKLDLMKPAESLVNQYWRPLSEHLSEQSEMLSQHMRDLLIEPFSRFYGIDIKAAELHRKAFEEESKEYYSFLSRYMGMKQDNTQKKQEADAKHEKKRRNFELRRLEYWNFLIDMKAGGSKGDELCLHLTNYTEKHCQHVMEMGGIAKELQSELADIAAANKERQERNIEQQNIDSIGSALSPPSKPFAKNIVGLTLAQPGAASATFNAGLDSPRTPQFDRESFDLQLDAEEIVPSNIYGANHLSNNSSHSITGIRDLEHQDIDASLAMGRRKEGFLFATSRPTAHNGTVLDKPNINWHKYWCVLSEGQLHEYSNWRKGVTQPHIEPINLRIATVRSCRNQDRRFCFEVITPKFRRVYQAMNADDMNSWINVISNAIQGLLNGTSSCRNLNLEYTVGGGGGYNRVPGSPDGKGLMAGLSGMARPSMEHLLNATSLPSSLQDRFQPGQAFSRKRGGNAVDGLNELGQIIHPIAAQSNLLYDAQKEHNQLGVKLLLVMREQHSANTVCADCGAKNPDWCVINLGILVCIECSGIHRSLGTHISKVRSLNLDTTSYTKDLFEFIRSVGNNVSNEIWEANLANPKSQQQGVGDQEQTSKVVFKKPVVNDPREYKVAFIRKKYVDRSFLNRPQDLALGDRVSRATDALFRAVTANDIPAAISAFAAGANINAVQKADNYNDTGLFTEQDSSSLPSRKIEDMFGLKNISSLGLPLLDENVLHSSSLDDSATSETSSQLSRSTMGSYSVSATEEIALSDQRAGGTLEIRPRPLGARPISSVMILQTTPLLIALRQGVPFTLEDGSEVYPLAEFLMLNGAAGNMSMEVKINNEPATGLTEPSRPTNLRKAPKVKPEDPSEGVIERDVSQTSSSIGSRLSAGAASTSASAVSPVRISIRNMESNNTEVSKIANRRSVGQIMELMGEDGMNAVEYLRAKGIGRGESAPIAPSNSSPIASTSTVNANAAVSSSSWQGGSRLRPSSLKDMSIANMSTPSMSNTIINKLTLSPRLRPSGSATSGSELTSPDANNGGIAVSQRDSRVQSANHLPSYPPPVRYNNQDIATLFQNQKRRGSDGGTGSGLFSSMKASNKDKERAAAKAQARRSGDFSMFRPPSILSSLSQQSDASSNTYHITSSPPTEEGSFAFPEGHQLFGDSSKGQNGSNSDYGSSSNIAGSPSRTQKVRASLTKSIRMSAAYLRGSVIKDDNKAKSAIITKEETQSRVSMSPSRLDSDDEDDDDYGEELTVAELLALQDQNQEEQQQDAQLPTFTSTNRASSKSFFPSMFSSSPNLS